MRDSMDAPPDGTAGPEAVWAGGKPVSAEWLARWRAEPLHKFLDLALEAQRDGYCRIVLRMGPQTRGGVGGSVHGGIIATLVDIVTIGAVASAIEPHDVMNGTAELNISYLRPALGAQVVAEGRVLKKGRSLAVVDAECSDGAGRLFAKGRAQYALRQREPPPPGSSGGPR
ncbi:MAG TPA: PaaI family thioesterase [Dehalococcoidia bacterium]|nr:PaaI family thioesterase [Dehalococcoidia bacterium]